MTALRQLLDDATARLAGAGVPSPRVDARALAAHLLDVSPKTLGLDPDLPDGFAEEFETLVQRRVAREPLQHLVGSTGFRYLDLIVRPGVFVPRPETEVVAGVAIEEAKRIDRPIVVDLCCGTGPIAVSVAHEVPDARVYAVDVSAAAVQLTGDNARAAGARLAGLVESDVAAAGLLDDLDGTVDVLVANPPYIPPDAVPIDPEVAEYDPPAALFGGGPDGLEIPRAVVAAAARLLHPGGLLVMEHADVQGAEVRDLVAGVGGFENIETHRDLTDRDRFVTARRV